jgi:hypothetical protein
VRYIAAVVAAAALVATTKWRKFVFAPITTIKIRLWITDVPDSWSRLVELQVGEELISTLILMDISVSENMHDGL